jgi:hypothetical protein
MAKDFKIEGAALVIEEGGVVIFENPKRDVYFDNSELVDNARVVLYDTNGTNKNASSIFSAYLSECTDNGTPFTEETLRAFSRENLGFNQGGGSPSIESGFMDYNDTTGTVSLFANTWTDIPNDGLGSFTNKAYKPEGVTELLDVSTGYLDASETELGETILVRNDYQVNPNTNNALLEFRYELGNGAGIYTLEKIVGRLDSGSGQDYRFSLEPDLIYMGDTNTKDSPIKLQLKLSTNGTFTNAGSAITLIKR